MLSGQHFQLEFAARVALPLGQVLGRDFLIAPAAAGRDRALQRFFILVPIAAHEARVGLHRGEQSLHELRVVEHGFRRIEHPLHGGSEIHGAQILARHERAGGMRGKVTADKQMHGQ
jgi:hypothetical protein